MLAPPPTRRSTEHRVEKPPEPTAESIWDDVSRRLRDTLNETTYETWFASARPVALRDDSFVVAVPNDFTRGWIESHFLGLVSAAVRDSLGREVRVALEVEAAPVEKDDQPVLAAAGRRGGGPARRRTRSTRSTTS